MNNVDSTEHSTVSLENKQNSIDLKQIWGTFSTAEWGQTGSNI